MPSFVFAVACYPVTEYCVHICFLPTTYPGTHIWCFSPWLLKRCLISLENKINLFCYIGMRLQTVEAEVRFRCAAVLDAWAWKQRPLLEDSAVPGVLCVGSRGSLGMLFTLGGAFWMGTIRSPKPIAVFFWGCWNSKELAGAKTDLVVDQGGIRRWEKYVK